MAIVFDLDGTLVESPLDFRAMHKAVVDIATRSGVPRGEFYAAKSVPQMMEIATRWLRQADVGDGPSLRFEAEVNRALDVIEMSALPHARPAAGVKDVLTSLHQQGYRFGLLTRSCDTFAKACLHKSEVLPLFSKIRTRNDSGPAKPDPESLSVLLREMNVIKDRTVFVGDRALDIECSTGAGVDFIGIVHPGEEAKEREDELKHRGAFKIVHSFAELRKELTGE
jgi:phosphoglycolate phosphatase-like HAD superfamily hydrolase